MLSPFLFFCLVKHNKRLGDDSSAKEKKKKEQSGKEEQQMVKRGIAPRDWKCGGKYGKRRGCRSQIENCAAKG